MSKRRCTSIAIATLCLFTIGIAPHVAKKSVGATLSERFSSLGGMFKKDDSQAQPNRSSTHNSGQRSARTGYGKTRQRRATTANSNSRSQTSSKKRRTLSSYLPESLFGKKESSQNVANNRQQQQSRQQQANSQNRNRRNAAQASKQKRNSQSAKASSQLATDLPQVVEDRKAPVTANARKSPTLSRRDELQEALTDLVDSDDLLPGSVIVDSEETVVEDDITPAPGAAVLAIDDYGSEFVDDTEDVAESAETAIVEDTETLVAEEEYLVEEDIVADQSPAIESYEVVGNLPLPEENFEEQAPEEDYSPETQDDAEFAIVDGKAIYEQPQQAADGTIQEEVPFGQADLDVHDALLNEDLYAMPEETEVIAEAETAVDESFADEQALDTKQPHEVEIEAELEQPVESLADDSTAVEDLVAEPALKAEELVADNSAEEEIIAEPAIEQESALTDELYYSASEPQEAPSEPQQQEQSNIALNENESTTDQQVASIDAFNSISELAADSLPEPQEVIASDTTTSDSQSNEARYPEPSLRTTSPGSQQQSSDQFADVVESLESQPSFAVTKPTAATNQEISQSQPTAIIANQPAQQSQPIQQSKPQQQLVRQDIKTASQPKPREATRLIRPHGDVLTSTEQPVIMSHVEGPRSILVGKEASYRVVLENTSQTEAQNLSASVKVPEWADLVDVVCSAGIVEQSREGSNSDTLQWHLPQLGAHSSQTMQLQLIPRSGRAFQLGVQWSQETATTKTVVEVKEPKLQMAIEGPENVLFGDPKRYRLVLKNPGNGPAENVALTLIPPGSDSISAKPHVIGTLGPSEVKEIEIELTARETGELILQANAEAAGDLKCEVIKRVQCRKPELEVDWRGPEQKYAGTESAYYFRVHNPGTAATGAVDVKVRLPTGIKFLSASDSFSYDATSGLVTWRLEGLRPSEEQFMQFRCELERPGLKEFEVEATSQGGLLSDAEWIRTEVIALADLKLDVRDPRGAHPTGEPVTYEIRVENRGTTDAEGISIVGLFSEGIDPVSVEGAQSSVRDGRVNFQTVKTLPPGGEILLKIRAVASDVGTHIFRAEVTCHDLDIKLAAEETTRFFKDDFQWSEGETPYTASRVKSSVSR